MSDPYADFLIRKAISDPATGLTSSPDLPGVMFPFQHDITAWALRRGRAALFAGTGLGKSLMELAWADAVHRETGRDILHVAPLAVSSQMAREADKFALTGKIVREQSDCIAGNNITNYQKIDHFDLSQFGGVILDESSILKSTDGHYRTRLIEACAGIPFRLAATATPAPNDFMELGNHAEFLGVMSYTDMLATFFTHDGGDTQKWRLKGHAEDEFWKWLASWSVMLRKPSDLGYDNAGYDLPPLNQIAHVVPVGEEHYDGLFPKVALSMSERIKARRDTVSERVAKAISIVTADLWSIIPECHGNQNTNLTDAQKLRVILSTQQSSRPPVVEPQKKTGRTCEHTTPPISTNGKSERESSKTKSTLSGESGTPLIQNLPNNIGHGQGRGAQKSGETGGYDLNTVSPSINTTNFSEVRADAALFATEPTVTETASPLTIATIPAPSGASSAQNAISQSVCSGTIATDLIEQSNISQRPSLNPWVIWCHLNKEQDAVKAALGDLAISIHGGHGEDEKEELHRQWLEGYAPVIIVKPSMFGHGLNWQHCHNMAFVGLNDSFEQVFQAVRRCWRFGQTMPVTAHFISAETEGAVLANIRRKEADADRMAAAMILHMSDISSLAVRGSVRDRPNYDPQLKMEIPAWLAA